MLNFIFFGRLEYSKGIDFIINFVSNYSSFCLEKSFNFYIFGDGAYSKEVRNLEFKYNFIKFFGWRSKDTIKDFLKKSDFTLMPSRFIETFGLSALESLAEGVPVIGFRKGGLKDFIFDEFDIGRADNDTFNKWFLENDLWDRWNKNLKLYYKDKSINKAKEYSLDKWLDKFLKIIE